MRKLMAMGWLLALACGGTSSSGTGSGSGGTGYGPDGGTDAGIADAGSLDAGLADAGSLADAGATSGIVAISLSQTDIQIRSGASTAFAVTGTQADGTRVDVTPQSQAVSSNAAVATVQIGPGSQIQVHAISPGTATITVTYGSLQQTASVTVTQY
jgi:hypothetical protein